MSDTNERSVASIGSVANRTSALMLAGQCWCDPQTSGIEMDARLANSFADRVVPLLDEIDRLRLAIRRLAEQDATLSVCDGNVIVEMDSITDKEFAAIEIAVAWVDKLDEPDAVAALEGLLRRAGGPAKADVASLRLKSEEEEAIRAANAVLLGCSGDPERLAKHANVLRGLLERHK